MSWKLFLRKKAKKDFLHFPKSDQKYLKTVFREIAGNPFSGDIKKMKDEKNAWRRRVGAYRIFYEVRNDENVVYIYRMKRRTSKTY